MTHALSLLRGATTINLSTDPNFVLEYVPRSTDRGDMTVTESALLWISAASATALQTSIRGIEDFLKLSRNRQSVGAGEKCYVQLMVDGEGLIWRSEILDGRIELADEALHYWTSLGVEALVTWTRRSFWERGSLTSLGLKRTGITKTTAGVLVYNHEDSATHENFVDIEGADIIGAIPAPLHLSLKATAVISSRRFFLSGNTFHAPSGFQAVYEGEDSTAGGGALESVEVDALSSGGNFMRVTWTTSIAHTRNAWTWAISSTQLGYAAGSWLRVLARFANTPPANCYAKVKVKFDSVTPLTTLGEGQEILLDSSRKLQDLGSIQLPPGFISTGFSTYALALVISLRHVGTSQLDLDFIQLSGPDGVHRFDQRGYALSIDDLVTDDGPNEAVYIVSSALSAHIVSNYSPPLLVWPGRDARIRMLFDEGSGMVVDRTFTMFAQYRPRRLTV